GSSRTLHETRGRSATVTDAPKRRADLASTPRHAHHGACEQPGVLLPALARRRGGVADGATHWDGPERVTVPRQWRGRNTKESARTTWPRKNQRSLVSKT